MLKPIISSSYHNPDQTQKIAQIYGLCALLSVDLCSWSLIASYMMFWVPLYSRSAMLGQDLQCTTDLSWATDQLMPHVIGRENIVISTDCTVNDLYAFACMTLSVYMTENNIIR